MGAAHVRNLLCKLKRACLCELRFVVGGGRRADHSYYATGFETTCDCHRGASVSAVRGRLRVARTPCGDDRGDMAPYFQVSNLVNVGLVRRSRVSRSHAFEKRGQQKDVLANCSYIV